MAHNGPHGHQPSGGHQGLTGHYGAIPCIVSEGRLAIHKGHNGYAHMPIMALILTTLMEPS